MKRFFALLAVACACAPASAQEYIGIAAGSSNQNVDCGALKQIGYELCDRSDTGYKVHYGFKIDPRLAVEVGYINYGKATASDYASAILQMEASAFNLALVARRQFNQSFTGLLRLGVSQLSVKVTEKSTGVTTDKFNGLKPFVGLGLEYAYTDNLKAILSFDATRAEITGYDQWWNYLISLGLQYEFDAE